jgi:hypothetical protein
MHRESPELHGWRESLSDGGGLPHEFFMKFWESSPNMYVNKNRRRVASHSGFRPPSAFTKARTVVTMQVPNVAHEGIDLLAACSCPSPTVCGFFVDYVSKLRPKAPSAPRRHARDSNDSDANDLPKRNATTQVHSRLQKWPPSLCILANHCFDLGKAGDLERLSFKRRRRRNHHQTAMP